MEEQSIIVFPSSVKGIVRAPAGKSMMQRALLLALINEGKTIISNPGKSDDDQHVLEIIKSLGAKVIQHDSIWEVIGVKKINNVESVNCGESGLALRMFVPLLSVGNHWIAIHGKGTLAKRKHQFPMDVFTTLNISLSQENHGLPISVKGPIIPADCTIPANESSQYVSGLLMALASVTEKKIEINFNNPVSKPYIDLTLEMMHQFGYVFEKRDNNSVLLFPKENKSEQRQIFIEGDWSGASFLILSAVLAGEIEIVGLNEHSVQADRKILEILKSTETDFRFEGDKLMVQKNVHIKPFHFDATDCPDLFPVLSVLASYSNGRSTIIGVNRLYNKESNRASALVENLNGLGVQISIEDNEMHIQGNAIVRGGTVQSFDDHRIVMAMACAGLRAEEPVKIFKPACISKSYPDFFSHLRNLGADIQSSINHFQS